MLIRLLCAHEMTKHVCKISRLHSERLLRKLQKMLGGYFILPHPVVSVLTGYKIDFLTNLFFLFRFYITCTVRITKIFAKISYYVANTFVSFLEFSNSFSEYQELLISP